MQDQSATATTIEHGESDPVSAHLGIAVSQPSWAQRRREGRARWPAPRGLRRRGDAASPFAGVAPFDRYPARMLTPLAPHVDRLRVPQGRALAHEGWLVREVLVVLAGEVIAIRGGQDCLRIDPGAHIGATELLRGGTHPASLVAGANLELLVINGPAYRWAARSLPGLVTFQR